MTTASILTVVAAVLLVTSFAFWSATRSDEVYKQRLSQAVAYALSKSAQQIPYDQESVAFWDDAVVHTRNSFNPDWVAENLGIWMHDYFKHDRVDVLDGGNRVTYTMIEGNSAPVQRRPIAPVQHLADTLREMIKSGALDAFEAGRTRLPRASDFALVDNRPAIISVMALVPHTKNVSQERGTENFISSVRFLDRDFLVDLGATSLLEKVRYSPSAPRSATEQAYPVTTKSGTVIGYFVWTPKLPGTSLLGEMLPVLAAGLAGVGATIMLLIFRLRQTYTGLITSEANAKHLAFHDHLTGLPNRTHFNECLEGALFETRTAGLPFALMFLDLDRFKQVNDTLGHAAGDELIRCVSTRIREVIRSGDVAARMGGDEFAIVVRNIPDADAIDDLTRTIVDRLSRPFDIFGNKVMVGVSIGVALAPACGLDRSELARKADFALYQAKRDGGLRAQVFNGAMSELAGQRSALEQDLRRALETGSDLEVVYQPLYSSQSLEISGVEALVRWHHPMLGRVPPMTFVTLAEECGLIDKLGSWVLTQACSAAATWDLGTLAVNVSAIQLRQPGFARHVLDALANSGLEAGRLEIEIIETTLLDEHGTSSACLNTLREAGVRIALDDFGTGYSSLSLLMNLDVDRIKIDRSFVRHLGQSSQSNSIVQAIVTMAHAVGVAVTAEGVETDEQRDFLAGIGCDTLQGYLLSAPVKALDIMTLVANARSRAREIGSAVA